MHMRMQFYPKKASGGRWIAAIFAVFGVVFLLVGIINAFITLSGSESYLESNSGILSLSFGFMGAVWSLIGFAILKMTSSGGKKRKRLMAIGESYNADVTSVYNDTFVTFNGRNPLVVECTYRGNDGRTYLVKSGRLWEDSVPSLEDIQATVWVNPKNPKEYHVEVDFHTNLHEDCNINVVDLR